jgi:hypothetical protein
MRKHDRETRMRMRLVAGLLLSLSLQTIAARAVDTNLMREVEAVRAEMARSNAALREYTWTEHTEVIVGGNLKSATATICRYDLSGELTKTPLGTDNGKRAPSGVSKRPMVRKKADMQDYVERAVTRIHEYVPPKPEQIDFLLRNGDAAFAQSEAGKSELRFKNYFERGDALVFTYDPVTKRLLRASVISTLGSPKDPISLEVAFETLPDGVNHVTSATLNAKRRNVQVKTRNVSYQKVAN